RGGDGLGTGIRQCPNSGTPVTGRFRLLPRVWTAAVGPGLADAVLEPAAGINDLQNPVGFEHLEPLRRRGLADTEKLAHHIAREKEILAPVLPLELPAQGD